MEIITNLAIICLVVVKVQAVQSNPKAWMPPLVLFNKWKWKVKNTYMTSNMLYLIMALNA